MCPCHFIDGQCIIRIHLICSVCLECIFYSAVNVDAIAETIKCWHLTVRLTGAADSADGSLISQSRADYISKLLQARGVPVDKIQTVAEGGIEWFTPFAVNRQLKLNLCCNNLYWFYFMIYPREDSCEVPISYLYLLKASFPNCHKYLSISFTVKSSNL